MTLERYFEKFRRGIVGYDQTFATPYGQKRIVYADWTGSGRLYLPIEEKILKVLGPFVGNTHTQSTVTGTTMTEAYQKAKKIIKKHVGADSSDALIAAGSGMTAAVNKLQRLLGLRVPEKIARYLKLPESLRPIVFVTHLEHHSNHISWRETVAQVEQIRPDAQGLIDLAHLKTLLWKYRHRKNKIAAVTACSNVTGIQTPYYEIAKLLHENDGVCFVDFACSAPYVSINMHPKNQKERLDAVYFSPHKFLGGPGSAGILIFNSALYSNKFPDRPGGGTVLWTNPWGQQRYFADIETREDGGTPAFLQTIKAALAICLKEKMGIENLLAREKEILSVLLPGLKKIKGMEVLAGQIENRLGVISFNIKNLHYNLAVKLLNDRYGIQTRGGCACAGTYGHYLFKISKKISKAITDRIDTGDLSTKPGFVRISIHPVMTNQEINFILEALREISASFKKWRKDYRYHFQMNEFVHKKNRRLLGGSRKYLPDDIYEINSRS